MSPVALHRPSGTAGKRGSRQPQAVDSALDSPPLDLSARLHIDERTFRSSVRRQSALIEMVRAVNSTLDPTSIAELVIQRATTWMPVPNWFVVSSDLSGELSVLADSGLAPDMIPAVQAIAGWVMRHGGEFVSAELARDERVQATLAGTALAFALVSRGRTVGALIGLDRKPSSRPPRLTPGTLRALRLLLEPAGTALDNAILLKRAEALSVTDDLTRVYNLRYLNLVLRRETKRAARNGRPLSLLFIDLDGFKSVNDSHGHLRGSRALVEAAAVIRGSARETDVVARFGGDEFALVLPETGASGAFAVGERLRERIAAHRFLSGEGLEVKLTVSVGVATIPDVAGSAEDLVQAADMAMYRVKQSGKNGIQAAAAPADN